MPTKSFFLGALALLPAAGAALADPSSELVVVTGRRADMGGIAASANEGVISAADMNLRPLLRPGEIVENIPGVIVTQHSGSGKANQYFLRGFNLDHGSDLAISLDGVPVNMVTHAHGQGYSDLNFVIPELIRQVDYKKGPYYADVGDFGAAGAFNIAYYDRLPTGLARLDGGQTGYVRAVIADNANIGRGNLVYGLEAEHNDGPWDHGDDAQKFSGMLRYTKSGWALTAMAYHNAWNATDQVPDRALATGAISRWGAVDPSDGGKSGRYSLSAAWTGANTRMLFYGLYYDLDLKSNFTYFLDDPVNGDQFEQQDARWEFGGKYAHDWNHSLLGAASQTTFGLDGRSDLIHNGLYHTVRRARLSTTTLNGSSESSLSPYVQNETHWTPWLRSIVGARGDFFWFDVRDLNAGPVAGHKTAAQFSPKAGLVLGPFEKTELYLNFGYGFHSNDARGIFDPAAPATPLARAVGAEAGLRSSILPGLQSSITAWTLTIQSELVWAGDAGTTEPSGRTRRYGVEFANFYTPVKWLTLDVDYAWSHTRYIDPDPAGQYVPEALGATFDGGIALHDLEGWASRLSGGLRLRYFGPRTLTQDNLVRSRATTLLYADLGYDITPRFRLGLDVFNLLDARASDIDYYYTSRLPGEAAAGVDDIHTHPSEPREFRLSLTMKL